MGNEKIVEDTEQQKLACPHCGGSDVWSIGTMKATAKAKLIICEGSTGVLDWDYGECESNNEALIIDDDYEHDDCWCKGCRKSFDNPDIVPLSELEKGKALMEQLEREGQQTLFKGAGDDRNE